MNTAIDTSPRTEPVEYAAIPDEGARFLVRAAFHWTGMLGVESFTDDDVERWFQLRDAYGLEARDVALVDAVAAISRAPRRRPRGGRRRGR